VAPPEIIVGPLLRYVGERDAMVWVETDGPCEVEVLGARATTFGICGHHYALVCIEGLEPEHEYPYEVRLDGHVAWPDADAAAFPPSAIRTRGGEQPLRIAFGSCRVAFPHVRPWSLKKDDSSRGREVDALFALALRMRQQDPERWPQTRCTPTRFPRACASSSATARRASATAARATRWPTSRSTRACTTTRGAIPRSAG
jgi:hypothetical protein